MERLQWSRTSEDPFEGGRASHRRLIDNGSLRVCAGKEGSSGMIIVHAVPGYPRTVARGQSNTDAGMAPATYISQLQVCMSAAGEAIAFICPERLPAPMGRRDGATSGSMTKIIYCCGSLPQLSLIPFFSHSFVSLPHSYSFP